MELSELCGARSRTQEPVPSVFPIVSTSSIVGPSLRGIPREANLFSDRLLSLGTGLASWNIDDCAVRVLAIYSVKLFRRFPIIQGTLHISEVAALSVRSACNAPVAFQGSRVRRYGSAVGPHWSLLKTFFSAIKQLHTSAFSVAEDYYRRHGSRRIGPHRSILKCQLRNYISLDRFHIFVSSRVFHWFTF